MRHARVEICTKALRAPPVFPGAFIGPLTDAAETVAIVQVCRRTLTESPVLGAANVSYCVEDCSEARPLPSQFTWERTLPAGPGLLPIATTSNENSPIAFPYVMRSSFLYIVRCQPSLLLFQSYGE